MEHHTTTPALDLEFYCKNEGNIYGEGAALLAERVALAVAAAKPNAKARASAAARALRAFAKATGHKPALEVFMRPTGCGRGFMASYEAGPYQWGIVAADALGQLDIFGEPNWSFDICFYD